MNWIAPGTVAAQERENRARAEEIIEFCGLTRVRGDQASTLSGGQLKLLELARVLMADPKIILLDEPAAGVNPSLYESAVVDGASRWQMMWRITIPSILPTILIMLIIRIGNIMEVSFELIILLYQPATYSTADVVNTWVQSSVYMYMYPVCM